MSVKGSGTLLFQSQPWSCGASVCFLDNKERKPPFRRPGRPQQPHTHTETHRLTGSRPHAGACVSRSRQHCPPPGGKEGGTTQPEPQPAYQPQPISPGPAGPHGSTHIFGAPPLPTPTLPHPHLAGGAKSGGWRAERELSLRNSSLALVWCVFWWVL